MPFSFAHPAAALPLIKRNNMNATALVLGSMAPDFEYFARFEPVGFFGHSLSGFLLFNLPLCFFGAYVFHLVVKRPFIACLPHPLDEWFWDYAIREWRLNSIWSVWVFAYSALLGMTTHVLWDGFTHQNGWFVVQSPILLKTIYLGKISVPGFKILQHGSTVAGLTILIAFCYRLRNQWTKAPVLASGIKRLYFGSIVFTGVALCMGMFFWHRFLNAGYSGIGAYIITFLNGLIFGTIVASIVFIFFKRYKVNGVSIK